MNKTGSLQHKGSESVVTSYRQQADLTDMFFPPIRSAEQDFSYWDPPLPDINPSQLD